MSASKIRADDREKNHVPSHPGALAGTALGIGAIGLGLLAAQRVGRAYGMTVEQMYEQQRMSDYYNQQAYYQNSGRHSHSHHRESSGYNPYGYNYGYYR